jgi:MSHA biogenesis protein MshM
VYLRHFGLREKPFSLTPHTGFFVPLESHRQALETLVVALAEDEGFIKVIGEVGTGKTLLCRMLLERLDDAFVTAWLPNPFLGPEGVYDAVARELGAGGGEGPFSHRLLERIQDRVLELHATGRRAVLIVDEAQSLPTASLEAIRLLTNLETRRRKLLQVVLLGQPELDARLRTRALRQLAQRVSFSARLEAVPARDARSYLAHRLSCAGSRAELPFTRRAVAVLHRASRGNPRVMNLLSHKAMLSAYGRGETRVRWRHVRRAVADTEVANPLFSARRLAGWRRIR